MRNKTIFIMLMMFIFLSFSPVLVNATSFTDVPENHWSSEYIEELKNLNITDGVGDGKFGLGQTITKNEFVTFLVKLLDLELENPEVGSFKDNNDNTKWYYKSVETAVKHNIIKKDTENFNGNKAITRQEMAVMIVRSLGLEDLAYKFNSQNSPFSDVSSDKGYILISKDLGIITGVGGNKFEPNNTAKREEAAAMMIRMYNRLNSNIESLHGFYAIKSSNQRNLIKDFDSVGFGWSNIYYDEDIKDVVLNTTNKNNNEYNIPKGGYDVVNEVKMSNKKAYLMVIGRNDIFIDSPNGKVKMMDYILSNSNLRSKLVNDITNQVNKSVIDGKEISFDGVTIDIEGLKGDVSKKNLNLFLKELKAQLDKTNKLLDVAVHPKTLTSSEYYDGYDYKEIGRLADRVILMAHDYYAKSLTDSEMNSGYTTTPLTPINEFYYALEKITDEKTGVENKGKIVVQLSFDSAQWQLKDNKVINKYPHHPTYEMINERLKDKDTKLNFVEGLKSPYAEYVNKEDNVKNIIWYENEKSISEKIKLVKLFGIDKISIWRLGNIPNFANDNTGLNVFKEILNSK